MKKFFIGMFALALCLGLNSCKKEAGNAVEKAEEVVEQVAKKAPAMADIVAKAQAEGANWSVDEWKEQFKNCALAIKPMMVELADLTKQMEADPTKAEELMKAAQAIEDKYPGLKEQMDAFEAAAKATENGKKVLDDNEWGEKMLEELGIPKP